MIDIAAPVLLICALVAAIPTLWRDVCGPTSGLQDLALRIAVVGLACALWVSSEIWKLSNSRTYQPFGGIVSRASMSAPVVALSGDDGPSPQFTEDVLRILEKHEVRATFFVQGQAVESNMAAAQHIAQAGHELGNHSYSHARMVFKSCAFMQEEIERMDPPIRASGYEGDIRFRAPYSRKLIAPPYYLHRTGRLNISFDVEPESYDEIVSDSHAMVEDVLGPSSCCMSWLGAGPSPGRRFRA